MGIDGNSEGVAISPRNVLYCKEQPKMWHYKVVILSCNLPRYALLNGSVRVYGSCKTRQACVDAVDALPYPKLSVNIYYNPHRAAIKQTIIYPQLGG